MVFTGKCFWWFGAEIGSYRKHIGESIIFIRPLLKVIANVTSVVLIRGRSVRLGMVNGRIQFDESSRGWPQPGISSKRRIRQNAQKKYSRLLQ
jgi:hypothetical protein